MTVTIFHPTLAIIGAGPAGLMAAESAAGAGVTNIHVYDAMPSAGRKLLRAGIGGLNITHSEPHAAFLSRYGNAATPLLSSLNEFNANGLRDWCADLGIATFIGSSGRVFPEGMKATPLLRAWLARLKAQGVQFHSRTRWLGWAQAGELIMQIQTRQNAADEFYLSPQATVLALGGGSWSKLGSDGRWQSLLSARGIAIAPLKPANCGFNVAWSDYFKNKCAGVALKNIAISGKRGEFVITAHGLEGSLVYAHSAIWRDAIAVQGRHTVYLDLLPQHSAEQVLAHCLHPRGTRSLASHLQSRLGLRGVAYTLLRECLPAALDDAALLAQGIKALPITLQSVRPLDEAISSAGGVQWTEVNEDLMLSAWTGTFCAGEMLDWEAPTGGYLLNACWATGRTAGLAAAGFILNSN